MLTVVAAAVIAGAARLSLKQTSRVGVEVGEYSIIELRIRVAIGYLQYYQWKSKYWR